MQRGFAVVVVWRCVVCVTAVVVVRDVERGGLVAAARRLTVVPVGESVPTGGAVTALGSTGLPCSST